MKLTSPIFSDADKARAHFEAIRWPSGPVCPHCGEAEKVYRVTGKSARPGLIHCNACEGQFTVTTGGVMESSHVPLNKWALGFYLYSASKKKALAPISFTARSGFHTRRRGSWPIASVRL
jgi:transposase-like protein